MCWDVQAQVEKGAGKDDAGFVSWGVFDSEGRGDLPGTTQPQEQGPER